MDQTINQPINRMADRERSKRIDELLRQAIELEEEALAEFLDRACVGDAELRREVENILGGEVDTSEILKHSPAAGRRRQAQTDALRTGEKISHYRIESRIGRGGMGEVYLARDELLRRPVAIKILPPEFSADPARVSRFEQEAFAASRLNHPNIITILDIIHDGGNHFIATEFVDGQTLRQAINDGRLSLRQKLAVAVQIAEALSVAHEAGIVHRDIKPENVMLRRDGYVKLLDFGIAKLGVGSGEGGGGSGEGRERGGEREGEKSSVEKEVSRFPFSSTPHSPLPTAPPATLPSAMMGTVSYMSPEQARGERVDARTDIFSLGVVLYEMVAGRKPFEGEDNATVIAAILDQEPPLLTTAPRELWRIVARALNKSKERRYRTAAETHHDLQTLQKRLEQSASRRRNAVLKAMAALLAAFLAAGVLLGLRSSNNRERVEPEPVIQSLRVSGQVEGADISPDGQSVAYTANQGKTHSLKVWQMATSSEVAIVPPQLGHDCQSPTFAPDGQSVYYLAYDEKRNANLLYQAPVNGGIPRKTLEGIDSAVAVSPDGRQLAFVRETDDQRQTDLLIANAGGDAIRRLATRRAPFKISAYRAAWSPDGKQLAFAAGSFGRERDHQIYRISAEGGTESALSAHRLQRIRPLVWLKDNSGLALIASDQKDTLDQVWLLSFAGDRLRRLTDFSCHTSLGITASGNELLAMKGDEIDSLWVMPGTDYNHARQLVVGNTVGRNGITWTPDDEIIYAGGSETSPQLWTINPDGSGHRRFSFGAEDDDAPSITRDGRYVVFSSVRKPGSGNQIWRMDRDGGNLRRLTSGKFDVDPKVSPDGKWVVYISWDERNKGSIWKVPIDGGQSAQLTADHTTDPTPAISPDGKLLAYCHSLNHDRGRRIEVVPFDDNLSFGRPPINTFPLPKTSGRIGWAPDGRALIYIDEEGLASNLWRLPLDGGSRKQLTDFQSGLITWFTWSLDGRRLAVSRLMINRDLIRISGFR